MSQLERLGVLALKNPCLSERTLVAYAAPGECEAYPLGCGGYERKTKTSALWALPAHTCGLH